MILCCINDFTLLDFLCGRTDGVGKVQEGVFVHVAQVVFLLRIFSDGFGP